MKWCYSRRGPGPALCPPPFQEGLPRAEGPSQEVGWAVGAGARSSLIGRL